MATPPNDLPIYSFKHDIVSAIENSQVTIITAETGAGKSTQVPQYLMEHGYEKIIVTQPRILAARNLCARVRVEMALKTGKDSTRLVGYRTAHERDDGSENSILYCTDGLQLVRELTGSGSTGRQILVLDEIHEWNENMEVLIAWAKKRCNEEPGFKVVLMSATIEADELAAYFGAAAVIAVPGRSYPVEKRFGEDVVSEVLSLLNTQLSNMLVFLPGKAEIESVAAAINKTAASHHVPVLPLHSQLEPDVQQRVFASNTTGKIILATNIAQTSITIGDIDVVIDSGLERRTEVRNGVEGLFITQISQADCLQRAGRAGRTKPGLYILAKLDDMPCDPIEERPAYGQPAILRSHIDRLVLRLATIGIDIEELDFYHQPKKGIVKQAKHKLVTLGALNGKGDATLIGREMEPFPVESSYARMLVEAAQYPKETQAKLAAIIAILEVGGIVRHGSRYEGWKRLTGQTSSDAIGQYDVYLAVAGIDPDEYEEMGIIAKNITKADDVRERLERDLGISGVTPTSVQPDELEPLLRAIVSGQVDQLWTVEATGEAVHISTGKRRELSSGTLVRGAQLIAGTPFDLEIPTPTGLRTLSLVTDVTRVDPAWLETLAPHLFTVRSGKLYFDPHLGTLAIRTRLSFNGGILEAAGPPVLEYTPENQRLFIKLFAAWAFTQLKHERSRLQRFNSRQTPAIPLRHIEQRVARLAGGAVSLIGIDKKRRAGLVGLSRLETYIGPEFMKRLNRTTKNSHITRGHKKHHIRPRKRSDGRRGR